MGFLSQALGALSSSSSSGASPEASRQEIVGLIHHPSVGGVEGLATLFQNAGLGHLMQGWVGNGSNSPVTAAQITQVLGSPRVEELAAKLGISPDQAAQHLSQLLPEIIGHMNPNGTVPAVPTNAMEIFNLLKTRL